MASFSNMDIEEAKRRVREMHSRAESYVASGKGNHQNSVQSEKKNIPPPPPAREKAKPQEDIPEEKKEDFFRRFKLYYSCFAYALVA